MSDLQRGRVRSGPTESWDRIAGSGIAPLLRAERVMSSECVGRHPSSRHAALALLVSTALLVYMFITYGIGPAEIQARLGSVSYAGMGAAFGLLLVALLARAARYWILLDFRAALWSVTLVTLLRNLLVDVVPLRIGAGVAYLYAVIARLGVPADVAVASFSVAAVLDTLAMAPVVVLAVLVLGAGPLSPWLLTTGAMLVLAGAVAILILLAPILRLAGQSVGLLAQRLTSVARALDEAASTVRRLETGRILMPALALSFVVRLSRYGALYCLLLALVPEDFRVDFVRVSLSMAVAEMAAAMPVPTIGGWGTYELVGALAFNQWLGLPTAIAATSIVAMHALTQLCDLILGLPALAWAVAPGARCGARGTLRRTCPDSSSVST